MNASIASPVFGFASRHAAWRRLLAGACLFLLSGGSARAGWITEPPTGATIGTTVSVTFTLTYPSGQPPTYVILWLRNPAGTWNKIFLAGGSPGSTYGPLTIPQTLGTVGNWEWRGTGEMSPNVATPTMGDTQMSTVTVVSAAELDPPPVPTVKPGDFGLGETVVRPHGGARTVVVAFTADDYGGDLTGIRPNIWHPNSGYFDNNGGAMVPVSGNTGQVERTVTLDRDGEWYFWTDAVDYSGDNVSTGAWWEGYRIIVSEAPSTPPVPVMEVLGYSHGDVATRQNGLPLAVQLRFTATDGDGNLTGIRPNVWHPDSGYFYNNNGNFITQSGFSGTVALSQPLNHNGDWYFWTDTVDANGNYAQNPAHWSGGFRIKVVENAKDNGLSEWLDINADGLLDEVIRPHTGVFDYQISDWYTECYEWWYYPVNSVFNYWDTWWPWGDWSYGWEWVWYPYTFWTYYTCYTYVNPVLQFDTEGGYDYHVFIDPSGGSAVNPANWSEIVSGVFGSGHQTVNLGTWAADYFNLGQFYLVRYAVPPTGGALSTIGGGVLGQVLNGATITVPLPVGGSVVINPMDPSGAIQQLQDAVWTIMKDGVAVLIGGLPCVNLPVIGSVDIGGFGVGEFQICIRLPDGDHTQICFTVHVVSAGVQLQQYPFDVPTFLARRAAGTLLPTDLATVGSAATDNPHLQVGKWLDGFASSSNNTPLTNFVRQDPDQLFVRVSDSTKKGKGKLGVALISSYGVGTLDLMERLEVIETAPDSGVFLSEPLLPMSDDTDGAFRFGNKRQGLRVRLGGEVRAVYPEVGDIIAEMVRTVPPEKQITVEVVILRNRVGGSGLTNLARVQDQWAAVEERLAQVGIRVNWSIRNNGFVDPPAAYNPGRPVNCYTDTSIPAPGSGHVGAELRAVVDALGTTGSTSDLHVFYVGRMIPYTSAPTNQQALGFATMPVNMDPTHAAYGNNAFIDASNADLYGAAHELVHLLLNGVAETGSSHHSDRHNLMFKDAGNTRSVYSTKRLTTFEEQRILANTTLVHSP